MTTVDRWFKARAKEVEQELIRRLEIIYDRVPTNEEVKRDVHLAVYPNGALEYRHKGKIFLMVPAIEFVSNTP